MKKLIAKLLELFSRRKSIPLSVEPIELDTEVAVPPQIATQIMKRGKRPKRQPEDNPRWERPDLRLGTWVSVFGRDGLLPNDIRKKNFVGRGEIVSRGERRARVRLPDGDGTRREVKNLVPTRRYRRRDLVSTGRT